MDLFKKNLPNHFISEELGHIACKNCSEPLMHRDACQDCDFIDNQRTNDRHELDHL